MQKEENMNEIDSKLILTFKQKNIVEKYIDDRIYLPRLYLIMSFLYLLIGIFVLYKLHISFKFPDKSLSESNLPITKSDMVYIYMGLSSIFYFVYAMWEYFTYVKKMRAALISLKQGKFVLAIRKITYKFPANETAPYYIYTVYDERFECPVFLDYKNFSVDDDALCIYAADCKFAIKLQETA